LCNRCLLPASALFDAASKNAIANQTPD